MINETLRHARELKGWDIDELARRTGLRVHIVVAIEQGAFAELPSGLYSRAAIRSYATAVGMNADDVLSAVAALLPVPEDPLDGLARRYGLPRKSAGRAADSHPPSGSPCVSAFDGRFEAARSVAVPAIALTRDSGDPADLMLRERPAAAEVTDVTETVLPDLQTGQEREWQPATASSHRAALPWRPIAAAAIDGVLLSSIGAALVWLTAATCGIGVVAALRLASPAMAAVFSLIVGWYFVLFGGIGHATPGVMVMRLDAAPVSRTVLQPGDVFGRARRSVFHGGSLLAD